MSLNPRLFHSQAMIFYQDKVKCDPKPDLQPFFNSDQLTCHCVMSSASVELHVYADTNASVSNEAIKRFLTNGNINKPYDTKSCRGPIVVLMYDTSQQKYCKDETFTTKEVNALSSHFPSNLYA
ncbi:hypothetical protein EW145_g7438 [Phellinidium pouzarii]|uniref:Uncharacterized protein n=1 Tax=Phellinidium pouzarii TaxID=167371 RepID=A0A4S4KJI1_9AGAM|nr:hypothetical protein EW145_g7438 [Phellinidium pouzarii]